MGIDIEALKAYLDSDEGRESTRQYFQDLEDKREKKINFFESSIFNERIEKMTQYLLSNEYCLQTSDYQSDVMVGMSDGEFCEVVESVFENLKEHSFENEEIIFPNNNIIYKQLQFTIINGQGSFYRVSSKENS